MSILTNASSVTWVTLRCECKHLWKLRCLQMVTVNRYDVGLLAVLGCFVDVTSEILLNVSIAVLSSSCHEFGHLVVNTLKNYPWLDATKHSTMHQISSSRGKSFSNLSINIAKTSAFCQTLSDIGKSSNVETYPRKTIGNMFQNVLWFKAYVWVCEVASHSPCWQTTVCIAESSFFTLLTLI